MQKYLRKHYFTLFKKMITFSCTVRPNLNLVLFVFILILDQNLLKNSHGILI